MLTRKAPLAQPPPSFLHSPEGAIGRRGWKEGKGKKELAAVGVGCKTGEVWRQQ